MKRRNLIIGTSGLVLLLAAAIGIGGWYANQKRVNELEVKLNELSRQEKRSAVLRSVSAQMEEIALQQKEISDKQREEAIQQTHVANEMRERSEEERQVAIMAQKSALASERKALDAYDLAQNQREIAEYQRVQAEHSKQMADTLSYIALGRSLGSLSISQFQTGNKDIADLLCCAAYLYTTRYNGDIYHPSIFQALTLCSQSKREWTRHNGTVKDMVFLPNYNNELTSISTYGEVLHHVLKGNQLITTTILKNKQYDFRDLYINYSNKDIYVVSRTGELIIKTSKGVSTIPLNGVIHPCFICPLQNSKFLLIIGDNSLAKLNMTNNTIVSTQLTDYNFTMCSSYNDTPILFDNKGNLHYVKDINRIDTRKAPVSGKVTSYFYSKETGYEVYGMENGTLFLIDKNKKIRRLIGHRSRISKIRLLGNNLFSSSYDGNVYMWRINNVKIEPMPLVNTNSWITYFNFDNSKTHLWIGNKDGAISEVLVSAEIMFDRVKKNLTRDMTHEEWDYYIGSNIPYESFLKPNK